MEAALQAKQYLHEVVEGEGLVAEEAESRRTGQAERHSQVLAAEVVGTQLERKRLSAEHMGLVLQRVPESLQLACTVMVHCGLGR